jgi:uncharacterized membrane protein YfcA
MIGTNKDKFMLALSFFVIALLYAVVGFGGGSSYLAALAVSNVPYSLIPKLALICNLLVVSGSCYHFYKNKHFNKSLILPFVLASVPLAFWGGMFHLTERSFLLLLTSCLILAGVRLLFIPKTSLESTTMPSLPVSLFVGGGLGFLSGLVGIGGGIFLAPLMLNLKWGKPKEVASTASAFIFLNSLSGLVGQFTKGMETELLHYWPLYFAVDCGGMLGSFMGSHPRISQGSIQRLTAILILFISVKLLIKVF